MIIIVFYGHCVSFYLLKNHQSSQFLHTGIKRRENFAFSCLCHWRVLFSLSFLLMSSGTWLWPLQLKVRICIFLLHLSMKQQTHSLKGHGKTSGLVPHSNSSSFDFEQTPDVLDPETPDTEELRVITVCFELPRKCWSCEGRIYRVVGWWDMMHDRDGIASSVSMLCFLCAFPLPTCVKKLLLTSK